MQDYQGRRTGFSPLVPRFACPRRPPRLTTAATGGRRYFFNGVPARSAKTSPIIMQNPRVSSYQKDPRLGNGSLGPESGSESPRRRGATEGVDLIVAESFFVFFWLSGRTMAKLRPTWR